MKVIFPKGAFGSSEFDDLLDTVLRDIAEKAKTDSGEWAEKYGTDFENDTFMMHRFCWCERDDCPWCEGCNCDSENYIYEVDGKIVTYEEYDRFYKNNVPKAPIGGTDEEWNAWEKISNHFNSRRKSYIPTELQCKFCLDGGMGAPNFHYKKLDLKVYWYKYIGRSVKTNRILSEDELINMHKDCIQSLSR